jgi:hypothetical protein
MNIIIIIMQNRFVFSGLLGKRTEIGSKSILKYLTQQIMHFGQDVIRKKDFLSKDKHMYVKSIKYPSK